MAIKFKDTIFDSTLEFDDHGYLSITDPDTPTYNGYGVTIGFQLSAEEAWLLAQELADYANSRTKHRSAIITEEN